MNNAATQYSTRTLIYIYKEWTGIIFFHTVYILFWHEKNKLIMVIFQF
jgi:hypothetical protein